MIERYVVIVYMESNNKFADLGDLSSDNSASPMAPGLPVHYDENVDHRQNRYPHCIVWTPIPCLTYAPEFFSGPFYYPKDVESRRKMAIRQAEYG